MVRKVSVSVEPVFLLHAADLEHLAAEADHDDAGEIRVAGIAPLRAAQDVEALAIGRMAAAGAVHDRDDAVDCRDSRRARPERSTAAAAKRATEAEQFTRVRMPM